MSATIHFIPEPFAIYDRDPGLEFASECRLPPLEDGVYERDDLPPGLGAEGIIQVLNFMDDRRISQFEVQTSYWGYLSDNSDPIDPVLGNSVADVAQNLLDLYFNGDPEYWSQEDRETVEFLESLVEEEAAQ